MSCGTFRPFVFCLPFHLVFITIIYVKVLANRIIVVTPHDQLGQSVKSLRHSSLYCLT